MLRGRSSFLLIIVDLVEGHDDGGEDVAQVCSDALKEAQQQCGGDGVAPAAVVRESPDKLVAPLFMRIRKLEMFLPW